MGSPETLLDPGSSLFDTKHLVSQSWLLLFKISFYLYPPVCLSLNFSDSKEKKKQELDTFQPKSWCSRPNTGLPHQIFVGLIRDQIWPYLHCRYAGHTVTVWEAGSKIHLYLVLFGNLMTCFREINAHQNSHEKMRQGSQWCLFLSKYVNICLKCPFKLNSLKQKKSTSGNCSNALIKQQDSHIPFS